MIFKYTHMHTHTRMHFWLTPQLRRILREPSGLHHPALWRKITKAQWDIKCPILPHTEHTTQEDGVRGQLVGQEEQNTELDKKSYNIVESGNE